MRIAGHSSVIKKEGSLPPCAPPREMAKQTHTQRGREDFRVTQCCVFMDLELVALSVFQEDAPQKVILKPSFKTRVTISWMTSRMDVEERPILRGRVPSRGNLCADSQVRTRRQHRWNQEPTKPVVLTITSSSS